MFESQHAGILSDEELRSLPSVEIHIRPRQDKSNRGSHYHLVDDYESFSELPEKLAEEEQSNSRSKEVTRKNDEPSGVKMLMLAVKAASGNQKLINMLV